MSDHRIGWCLMWPDGMVDMNERYAYLDNAQLAAERMRRRYRQQYRVVEVYWREVTPAEEPREVVEPAPAPAQRFVCLKCGWSGPQSDTYTYPAANSTRWHMGCPYAVVPVTDAKPAGAADGEAG